MDDTKQVLEDIKNGKETNMFKIWNITLSEVLALDENGIPYLEYICEKRYHYLIIYKMKY